MKEEEAKLEVIKRIENRQIIFCPMINNMCRTDCESFNTPEIKNLYAIPQADKYYIDGGYCIASCLHNIGD